MTAADRALTALASVARSAVRTGLRAWLDLDVQGRDHVPETGGVLLAATHTSHADSLAVGAALGRRLSFLGAADLADTPVLGPLLPRLGLLPVQRGRGDAALLDDLADILLGGAALVVYPEGSRSRDGRVHRPRGGVARLAATTGVPVVPIGVTGTAAAWPVDERPRLLPRAPVTVRIGPALAPPDSGALARRAFTDDLHDALTTLAGRPRAAGLAPVGGGA